ncbi:MAG: TolC family protein [Planctomycetaceae bacterium]|nr:TolC family protein [Planctomycetaceae bacterium]
MSSNAIRTMIAGCCIAWLGAVIVCADDSPSIQQLPAERAPGLRGGALLPTIEKGAPVSVIPESTEYLIDLPSALQLAESVNPQIALSREAINEALALHLEAKSLLLPNLTAGANYRLHTGPLQASTGEIRTLREQSVYFGGGAQAVGSGTVPIPAVRIFSQLGDAIYAPLVAQQVVAERSSTSLAVENALLLDIASQYLKLVAAEASLESYRNSQAEMAEIERTTSAFARTGQGRDGDYKRARAEVLLLRVGEQRAQERAAVESTELARMLHLDPAVRLTTLKAPVELVQLVDPGLDLEQLVQMAMMTRPEVSARGAAISAAESRLKQEQVRPFLPLVSVGYSAGGFGGGSNRQDLGVSSFYQRTAARTDLDVWAIWSLQNLGMGNRAVQHQAGAERDISLLRRTLMLAQIRREVTEAHALSEALQKKIGVTRQQLQTAERGAWEELLRTRGGEGLPIEVINSVDLLSQARQDAITALLAYNTAQFQLFVAIGETPLGPFRGRDPVYTVPQGVDVPALVK